MNQPETVTWSDTIKNEANLNQQYWPYLDSTISQHFEEKHQSTTGTSSTADFPDLSLTSYSSISKSKNIDLKPPETKDFKSSLSNKTSKKLKTTYTLDAFMKVKKPQQQSNALKIISQKTIEKLLAEKIVTHRGKKRPGRITTSLKKRILKLRQQLQTEREVEIKQEEPPKDVVELAKKFEKTAISPIYHSRNFRPYCDNLTPKNLETATEELVVKLFNFQQNAYRKVQQKSTTEKYKKRIATGLNEAKKFLELKKTKVLIIATDLEGALQEEIEKIKDLANTDNIPVLFALKRRKLGYIVKKKCGVSSLTILNYEGADELFKTVIDELKIQKKKYKNSTVLVRE